MYHFGLYCRLFRIIGRYLDEKFGEKICGLIWKEEARVYPRKRLNKRSLF